MINKISVFWSDVTSKGSALRKACDLEVPDRDKELQIQQLATLQNPDGLAVDWVGRNLYW
jgi:low-density lipoprotein receptor-related protein 1 (alpha-2-macroglobulin receptor)